MVYAATNAIKMRTRMGIRQREDRSEIMPHLFGNRIDAVPVSYMAGASRNLDSPVLICIDYFLINMINIFEILAITR